MRALDSKIFLEASHILVGQIRNTLLLRGNTLPRMAKRERAADVLAANLDKLLKARGLSQPQLGEQSGVSQKTINNIVHKRNSPQLDSVEKLAEALGVELYQLLCPVHDDKFIALWLAWAQSDDRGKDDLRTIAEAMLKKHDAASDPRGIDTSGPHRSRGGAGK